MRVELYGLVMETPQVTFHLFSPWRCSALEHRLFDAIKTVASVEVDNSSDELKIPVTSEESFRAANKNMVRVLKGWQEDAADHGGDRRAWRWLIEADVDSSGYDMSGEQSSFWAFIRLLVERGGPGDDKTEEVDLSGFSICIHGER